MKHKRKAEVAILYHFPMASELVAYKPPYKWRAAFQVLGLDQAWKGMLTFLSAFLIKENTKEEELLRSKAHAKDPMIAHTNYFILFYLIIVLIIISPTSFWDTKNYVSIINSENYDQCEKDSSVLIIEHL